MKDLLKSYYFNLQGWKTSRKILVIESDDWGAERLASKQISEELIRNKWVSNTNYNCLDTLESAQDYYAMIEVLSSVKDVHSNHAVLTANYVVSNPDYDKIARNKSTTYYYLPFTECYEKVKGSENTQTAMQQAIDNKLFVPQFHGREHLQTYLWIKNLGQSKVLQAGFERNFFSFSRGEAGPLSYLSAFDYETEEQRVDLLQRIQDGCRLFQSTFGFFPETIIAPENTYNSSLLFDFEKMGFKGIQGSRMQKQTQISNQNLPNLPRKLGAYSQQNLVSLVRNVTFEPSASNKDFVSKALGEIAVAFMFNKPAVICSHRVNYVGGISEINRNNSLTQLRELLKQVVKKWPTVEFMSSAQLSRCIEEN
ncbi:hypothetical protein [Flavobacterium sp.]|uniref:hypothetical protein n=1 Tax=Flavobacterium sp. TaxID=239 RepID=UPI0026089ED2|nr:hypothetical protein [Flavobacterium sp.]